MQLYRPEDELEDKFDPEFDDEFEDEYGDLQNQFLITYDLKVSKDNPRTDDYLKLQEFLEEKLDARQVQKSVYIYESIEGEVDVMDLFHDIKRCFSMQKGDSLIVADVFDVVMEE